MPAHRKREYKTTRGERKRAKDRRDRLRGYSLCINGEAHGTAARGVRCTPCHETHRKSA